MTSLDQPNGLVVSEPRQQSNNRWDFFGTMMDLISDGSLRSGDIVVMDNAPIHVADDMLHVLEAILDLADVRLFFLPKYSPELNPCELVFAQVKRYLRDYRGAAPFKMEIAKGFSMVTLSNVMHYYKRCLLEFDRE